MKPSDQPSHQFNGQAYLFKHNQKRVADVVYAYSLVEQHTAKGIFLSAVPLALKSENLFLNTEEHRLRITKIEEEDSVSYMGKYSFTTELMKQ